MAPPSYGYEQSTLLSLLETSTSTPIFSSFSHFLLPFSDLTKPNPNPIPPSQSQSRTLARSLAKQFLSFLNRSLAILPKRLSDLSKLHPEPENPEARAFARELFDTYKLCLDCLESVSSQLACKPYVVYLQRGRLVYSLVAWGFYEEAEDAAFQVLDRLRGLDPGGAGELLPRVGEGVSTEMARLVVEVVVAIAKCVALRRSEDGEDYGRIIELVKEVQPWLGLIDSSTDEKLRRSLVTYVGKCALSLTVGLINFSAYIVHEFVMTALDEHAKSPETYQISEFVRRIFSSLFLLLDNCPSVVTQMLKSILVFLAQKSKIGTEFWVMEFIDAVSYCVNKCQNASTDLGTTVAEVLKYLVEKTVCQSMLPLGSILSLYATAMSFSAVLRSGNCDRPPANVAENGSLVDILTDDKVGLCNLAPLLVSVRSYIHHGSTGNIVPRANSLKDSYERSLESDAHEKLSPTCTLQNSAYLRIYANALKFLCKPFGELVNSRKKEFILEYCDASVISAFCTIQEACDELCHTFLLVKSSKARVEDNDSDASKIVINAAVASFTLSIRTKPKLQKNVHLIENIVASKWIEPQRLKHLVTSLYNLGVLLYRNGQLDEASKALKQCCKALWSRLETLCQALRNHSEGFSNDISENMVLEFFNEACTRTASILEVLWHCGIDKVKKIITQSLESWSVAEDSFRCLPGPMPLVKHWVKVVCRLNENMGENSELTLFTTSSLNVTKRALGKILQQELSVYEKSDAACPEFCQSMQLKIADILLESVHANHDNYIQRSMVLVRKAWATRDGSVEGLRKCIQILSEAISLMDGKTCDSRTPCHQLIMAYCLRALSLQEVESHSEQVIQDIEAALTLWVKLPVSEDGCPEHGESLFSDNSLLMLYNIVDLLAIKGTAGYHSKILKLVFRLFKQKNVPLENCISFLWDCRRLSHPLCASPVDYSILMNLSEYYGESCKSMDFWINCLKGSATSLVGFRQNFSCLIPSMRCRMPNHEVNSLSDLSVHIVKETAAELMSSVPVTIHSLFLAGYLYYDLSERLIATGHLFEAMIYAKEAHGLRTKLFHEKFVYSIEQESEKGAESGCCTQKLSSRLRNLHLCKSSARRVWSLDKVPWDVEACYISPWKVLQSYLESTLQVGIIHEKVGNAVEAETFLLWGKDIASSQRLPLFVISFCAVLGKMYCEKSSWDLAEKELKNAQHILVSSCNSLSCSKCKLKFEVIVEQQLGDFYQNRSASTCNLVQNEELSAFESLHRSSLEKLNSFLWKSSVSFPEETEVGSANTLSSSLSEQNVEYLVSAKVGNKKKMEAGNCRKLKNAPTSSSKDKLSMAASNDSRVTRSQYRLQNHMVELGLSGDFKGDEVSKLTDMTGQAKKSCGITCFCNNMTCWLCLVKEVEESRLLNNFINLKWEIVRRRLSVRVLSSIGRCVEAREQIHEAHKVIFHSISVLTSRNLFSSTPAPLSLFFDFVGKDLSNDLFSVEKAETLCKICWFVLKSYTVKSARTFCCDISRVELSSVVSSLMIAFVLCYEVPVLLKQVSRLLSVIFILSSSGYLQPLRLYCKSLSESHWASFFHQASVGTHFSFQFLFNMIGRGNAGDDIKDQCFSRASSGEAHKLPRHVPESFLKLEKFVKDFFVELPCTPVICISIVGGQCGDLLQDLLECSSCSWILLSRLNAKYEPVVMLLPVDSVSKENLSEASDDDDATFNSGKCSKDNNLKRWQCPWGFTVIDDVAPSFRNMLEENYLSSSIFPLEDTQKNRKLWWMQRKKLDSRLGVFLRILEDSWFGPWRYVLLGEKSNYEHMDLLLKNLVRNLKSKCKMDIHGSLLSVIVEGARHSSDLQAYFSKSLSLRKGCVLGRPGNSNEETSERLPTISDGNEIFCDLAIKFLNEYATELMHETTVYAGPVILVPDCEVQMLPWESLPILRKQEVYRMPSLGSISLVLDKICCQQREGIVSTTFPLIDPSDAFYLINPAGDLTRTQAEFENLFQEQNLKGKAGLVPSSEELALALKNHDLFIYLGHGSGAQYIPCQEIQKLEHCAASLLLGCSSGSLSLNGPYIPQGTPLAYLLAGSPFIVANLWEVTDVDIDRFGKAMLEALLNERSNPPTCPQCEVAIEFESMNIKSGKCHTKKKASKKKVNETCNSLGSNGCSHRRKVGSFMYQAREACRLPFLIGASPVCYGVPTGIRRKDL